MSSAGRGSRSGQAVNLTANGISSLSSSSSSTTTVTTKLRSLIGTDHLGCGYNVFTGEKRPRIFQISEKKPLLSSLINYFAPTSSSGNIQNSNSSGSLHDISITNNGGDPSGRYSGGNSNNGGSTSSSNSIVQVIVSEEKVPSCTRNVENWQRVVDAWFCHFLYWNRFTVQYCPLTGMPSLFLKYFTKTDDAIFKSIHDIYMPAGSRSPLSDLSRASSASSLHEDATVVAAAAAVHNNTGVIVSSSSASSGSSSSRATRGVGGGTAPLKGRLAAPASSLAPKSAKTDHLTVPRSTSHPNLAASNGSSASSSYSSSPSGGGGGSGGAAFGTKALTSKVSTPLSISAANASAISLPINLNLPREQMLESQKYNMWIFTHSFYRLCLAGVKEASERHDGYDYRRYGIELSKPFQTAAAALPVDFDKAKYFEFIEHFGTHVTLDVDMGFGVSFVQRKKRKRHLGPTQAGREAARKLRQSVYRFTQESLWSVYEDAVDAITADAELLPSDKSESVVLSYSRGNGSGNGNGNGVGNGIGAFNRSSGLSRGSLTAAASAAAAIAAATSSSSTSSGNKNPLSLAISKTKFFGRLRKKKAHSVDTVPREQIPSLPSSSSKRSKKKKNKKHRGTTATSIRASLLNSAADAASSSSSSPSTAEKGTSGPSFPSSLSSALSTSLAPRGSLPSVLPDTASDQSASTDDSATTSDASSVASDAGGDGPDALRRAAKPTYCFLFHGCPPSSYIDAERSKEAAAAAAAVAAGLNNNNNNNGGGGGFSGIEGGGGVGGTGLPTETEWVRSPIELFEALRRLRGLEDEETAASRRASFALQESGKRTSVVDSSSNNNNSNSNDDSNNSNNNNIHTSQVEAGNAGASKIVEAPAAAAGAPSVSTNQQSTSTSSQPQASTTTQPTPPLPPSSGIISRLYGMIGSGVSGGLTNAPSGSFSSIPEEAEDNVSDRRSQMNVTVEADAEIDADADGDADNVAGRTRKGKGSGTPVTALDPVSAAIEAENARRAEEEENDPADAPVPPYSIPPVESVKTHTTSSASSTALASRQQETTSNNSAANITGPGSGSGSGSSNSSNSKQKRRDSGNGTSNGKRRSLIDRLFPKEERPSWQHKDVVPVHRNLMEIGSLLPPRKHANFVRALKLYHRERGHDLRVIAESAVAGHHITGATTSALTTAASGLSAVAASSVSVTHSSPYADNKV